MHNHLKPNVDIRLQHDKWGKEQPGYDILIITTIIKYAYIFFYLQ